MLVSDNTSANEVKTEVTRAVCRAHKTEYTARSIYPPKRLEVVPIARGSNSTAIPTRRTKFRKKSMSYKIIRCPASAAINPCSAFMNAPHRPLSPDRLLDPWLLDTERLLSELARNSAGAK